MLLALSISADDCQVHLGLCFRWRTRCSSAERVTSEEDFLMRLLVGKLVLSSSSEWSDGRMENNLDGLRS